MNPILPQTLERIAVLTKIDQETQSNSALIAALIEEVGEFATALRAEKKMRHRELSEPSVMEAVDVFICGAMLYFVFGGKVDGMYYCETLDWAKTKEENEKLGPFSLLMDMSVHTGKIALGTQAMVPVEVLQISAARIMSLGSSYYVTMTGHSIEQMMEAANGKLDKWEKNQKKKEKK